MPRARRYVLPPLARRGLGAYDAADLYAREREAILDDEVERARVARRRRSHRKRLPQSKGAPLHGSRSARRSFRPTVRVTRRFIGRGTGLRGIGCARADVSDRRSPEGSRRPRWRRPHVDPRRARRLRSAGTLRRCRRRSAIGLASRMGRSQRRFFPVPSSSRYPRVALLVVAGPPLAQSSLARSSLRP